MFASADVGCWYANNYCTTAASITDWQTTNNACFVVNLARQFKSCFMHSRFYRQYKRHSTELVTEVINTGSLIVYNETEVQLELKQISTPVCNKYE